MEEKIGVEDFVQDIMSGNLERQISALNLATKRIEEIAEIAVQSIEISDRPILVAERVIKLGSITLRYLEESLHRTEDFEKRIAISLALLQFGSRSGLQYLLKAVEKSDEYALLVSQKLAQSRILEAAPAIMARLNAADRKDVDLIVALLVALKELNIGLPPELKSRFSGNDVPWQIQTILANGTLEP